MNAKQFSVALGNVRNEYVAEAVTYRHINCDENIVKGAREPMKKTKKSAWIKWGTMVACFAVVVVLAFSVLPNYLNQQGVTIPETPIGVITDDPDDATPPTAPEIHISMSNIVMNEIDDFTGADYARYNPETDNKAVWGKEDIAAYYGTDLAPAYIPDGLFASPQNDTTTVYIRQDGTVVEDTVWLGYYHAYYEDGSPKLTADIAACHGFSVTASKLGIINDCVYLLPENEVKTSDIEGTEVTFGYRSMPYGPYDPETHEPAGYYDMYVAEFAQDGIEYWIVAEQMEAEEVVSVVSSIICGEGITVD